MPRKKQTTTTPKQTTTRRPRKAKASAPADPVMEAQRLTKMDYLRFVSADNQMRSIDMERQKIGYEAIVLQQGYNEKRRALSARDKELDRNLKQLKEQQRALLVEFGATYNFDPRYVSIDDKTGTIHVHEPPSIAEEVNATKASPN